MTVGRLRAILVALGLLGAPALAQQPPAPASPALCRPVRHEDSGYVVCTIDLRRQEVRLFWKAPDGDPYGTLSRLAATQPTGRPLLAATNAGMYHADLSPVGLYVEDGRQLKAANTANGPGNFHLKPNGVFFVEKGRAGILETGAFLKRRGRPDLATQSGPMLVIDGALHPRITEEGPSRKVRNGVGIRDPQTVILAISDGPVSFGAFARLFRDTLACPDALFLDGSISALYAPAIGRRDGFLPLGPMLGVFDRPGR